MNSTLQHLRLACIALLTLACAQALLAVQPATTAWMVDAGSSHLANTYLSPLQYQGYDLGVQYERYQPMRMDPQRWRQQILAGVEFANTHNPAGNATMMYANLSGSWAMMRHWQLPQGFSACLGGATGLNIGGLYNRRNSNNPATALADWHLSLTGSLQWEGRLGRIPMKARWLSSIPLTTVFFSPDYDELYYEIYLGNRSGLVHWGWPGNFLRWDNLFTVDLRLGSRWLRLGFRQRLLSSEASNITCQLRSYTFLLGWVI